MNIIESLFVGTDSTDSKPKQSYKFCKKHDNGVGRWLPRTMFGVDRDKADGLHTTCKICQKAAAQSYYQRKKQAAQRDRELAAQARALADAIETPPDTSASLKELQDNHNRLVSVVAQICEALGFVPELGQQA